MSLWERINSLWPGSRNLSLNQNQSRLIVTLGGLAILGIALLLVSGLFTGTKAPVPTPEPSAPQAEEKSPTTTYRGLVEEEKLLEARLEEVLSQIAGVGGVSVRVTLAAGSDYQYTMNRSTVKKTVEEQDQAGGSRVTTEVNDDGQLVLARLNQYGEEQPLIERELRPEVDGVLVVADGAGSAVIREQLTRAVETVLNIPAYKVSVLPKEGGK